MDVTVLEPRAAELVTEITLRVLRQLADPTRVVVGVSNRHAHLSRADLTTLFGLDEMTVLRPVRQPGEFAARETVTIHGPRGSIANVRLMGPCRPASQVELSRTDCVRLGLDAPIAQSGHLDNAAPVEIEGPKGRVALPHAAIIAARHLHIGAPGAAALGVADADIIRIRVDGPRGGLLENVIVRMKPEWVPEIHLDTDEANALNLRTGDVVTVVKG